jgi:transketolase
MNITSIFIWTHDSIGVGEDGPTHQPIEHFAALRAIPGLDVVRPGDANEVAQAWKTIVNRNRPVGILLSRQNLPVFDRTIYGSVENVSKGAYILKDVQDPQVILIATGSEVSLAIDSAIALESEGIRVRVVSAPCLEWFEEQDQKYKESVLSPEVVKVSIEVGIAQGWHKYIGEKGLAISLEHYGASADAKRLFKEFGFSVENIVAKVKKVIK